LWQGGNGASSLLKGYYEDFYALKAAKNKANSKPIFSLLSNFEGAAPGSVRGADNNIKLIKEIIMLVRR